MHLYPPREKGKAASSPYLPGLATNSQDARGTWLRAHKRWVGNKRGTGNTVISQKEVVNTLACCRAGGQGHGKHERERWERDWRAGCRADMRMLLLK